jgi:hypothetical protein
VKIARLKRQADAAEADARDKWLKFRTHSERSLAIVRRRVGSSAGLAMSFSLGFMTGISTGNQKANGSPAADAEGTEEGDRGITYKLAHGPFGDVLGGAAIKLGTALFVRSVMNFLDEGGDDDAGRAETTSGERAQV